MPLFPQVLHGSYVIVCLMGATHLRAPTTVPTGLRTPMCRARQCARVRTCLREGSCVPQNLPIGLVCLVGNQIDM